MPEERESDLASLGQIWGKPRGAWPPEHIAPGVELRRIPIPQHAKTLRDALPGKTSFLVPYVTDPRAFYATIALHNYREEDEQACRTCRGAKYLRYERPSGHTLFGAVRQCPDCFVAPQRTEQPLKRRGEPWWSK